MFDMNGMEAFMVIVPIAGVLVLAGIAFVVAKGIMQWRANEACPQRSVDALVVSRRTDVRGREDRMSSTSYFVTFEEPTGERLELQVGGRDFGQFAEGDRGHLMLQGARFKGFTRQDVVDGSR